MAVRGKSLTQRISEAAEYLVAQSFAIWYALGMKDVSLLREGAFRSGRAANYLSFKSEVLTLAVSTPSSSNLAELSLARSKDS